MKTIKQNPSQLNLFNSLKSKFDSLLEEGGNTVIQMTKNVFEDVYPNSPGYKAQDTSKEAAETVKPNAGHVRYKILHELIGNPMTADECAEALKLPILYIRPRFSELTKQGYIRDTGHRRANESGKSAIVWEIAA